MDCISINQFNLSNKMRMLWEQHVFWTRLLIISILNNLKDLDATQTRLLQNPGEIAAIYGKFYGPVIQKNISDLLTEHLVIGAQLITATKNNNTSEMNRLNTLWYQNADKISKFLASFNPFYSENDLRRMFYTHLDLTKNEVSLRLKSNWTEDVKNFDILEKEAINMADYFSMGIVRQFDYLFSCNMQYF